MKTKIFHTVNNGFYLERGGFGVFFDGIHKGVKNGFSDTPEEIIKACKDRAEPFSGLGALFFTHKHIDHFDEENALRAVAANDLLLYAPKYDRSNVPEEKISDGVVRMEVAGFEIFAITTIHDGDRRLREEPHVSFAVNVGDESFFIAGDARFKKRERDTLRSCLRARLMLAFVNPFQLLSGESAEVIESLRPQRLVLAHMPFKRDDAYNTYVVFNKAIEFREGKKPELIIPEFERPLRITV